MYRLKLVAKDNFFFFLYPEVDITLAFIILLFFDNCHLMCKGEYIVDGNETKQKATFSSFCRNRSYIYSIPKFQDIIISVNYRKCNLKLICKLAEMGFKYINVYDKTLLRIIEEKNSWMKDKIMNPRILLITGNIKLDGEMLGYTGIRKNIRYKLQSKKLLKHIIHSNDQIFKIIKHEFITNKIIIYKLYIITHLFASLLIFNHFFNFLF